MLHVIDQLTSVADVFDALQASGGGVTYGLLVAALVLGALVLPIPEEAVFAAGGALAASGRVDWLGVYLMGWVVVLGLDVGWHALGARFGPDLVRSRLGRRVSPERWETLQGLVSRRGVWAVVGARFVMGMRIPAFVVAGALGLPRRHFLPAAALAGLVSAAIPLGLGYAFAEQIESLLAVLGTARWVLLGLLAIGIGWWLVRRRP